GHAGNTTVNIGNAGRLTDILGAISTSFMDVNVNDSADPSARTFTLDTYSSGGDTFGRITFGGAPIYYRYADTSSVTVNAGAGDDIFYVLGTGAGTTTTLNGGGGFDTFAVGGDARTGLLSGIRGPVRVDGQAGSGRVWASDFNGTEGRTFTLNGSTLGWGAVTVQAANVITFEVTGGHGDDTYRVQTTNGAFLWSLDNNGGTNT